MSQKLSISVGIAAYNEEGNIKKLLTSFLSQKQRLLSIKEILVVSSGSTDKTNQIVRSFSNKFPIIKLIRQKKRVGKASAVNILLSKAKANIIVLSSADIILAKKSLEKLVKPLISSKVGIVGSHPVPLNDPKTFFGYAAHLLWDIHHRISLSSPKMGECIAFRKVFKQIPSLSSVDEVSIESIVERQGYKPIYAKDAIIYNKGAENLYEFIARRRHIYSGHLATKREYGYKVSTLSGIKILFIVASKFKFNLRFIFWTPIIVALEAYSRFLGYLDFRLKPKAHTIWRMTESTKKLPHLGKLNV